MAKCRFEKGVRFRWNAQVYCVEEALIDGQLLLKNLSFAGKLEAYDIQVLETAWKDFHLVFEVFGHNTAKKKGDHIATSFAVADLAHLPPKLRDETLRRCELALPIYNRPASQRTRKDIEEYAQKLAQADNNGNEDGVHNHRKRGRRPLGEAKSAASIERWVKVLVESGGDPRALVALLNRQGKLREPRLGNDVEQFIKDEFRACVQNRQKRTVSDVRDGIAARILDRNIIRVQRELEPLVIPSERMIRRRIELSGQAQAILGRPQSRAEAHSGGAVMPGPRPNGIGERIEIDSTTLDIILVDGKDGEIIGRPTLTIGADKYSIAPWGMSVAFIEPGWRTVAACISHGMLPKPDCRAIYGTKHSWNYFGTPGLIVTDNGREFYNSGLADALRLLQVTDWIRSPRGAPWFRGSIERFMRTNNQGYVHKQRGTTFSNVVERGDYKSEKMACYTLEAFMKMLHMWLLDDYAQAWHDFRGGTQYNFMGGVPDALWTESERMGFKLPLHHSAEEVYVLLLPTDERMLRPDGIEYKNLNYQSHELAALRSRLPSDYGLLPIKHDMANLDFIYVMNPLAGLEPLADINGGIEWIRVPSTMTEYTENLPEWRHDRIVAGLHERKQAVDYPALVKARKDREAYAKSQYLETQSVRKRTQESHWVGTDTHDLPGMVPTGRIDPLAELTPSEPISATAGDGDTASADDDLAAYMGGWWAGSSSNPVDSNHDDQLDLNKEAGNNGR